MSEDRRQINANIFVTWDAEYQQWEVGYEPYTGRRIYQTTKNAADIPQLLSEAYNQFTSRIVNPMMDSDNSPSKG